MNIDVAVRDLGEVDHLPLKHVIDSASDEDWEENRHRQTQYDVHYNTKSLVMLFAETEHWPVAKVVQESAWALLHRAALPVIDDILHGHYSPGGKVIRAMAARLVSGAVITPHRDAHPSFHVGHRIHVPIRTNSRVRFTIDGRPYKFEVGRAYEINNQLQHSVMNKGDDDRIHFIFDYVPASELAALTLS
ncbi:aspartyl/asparaginyl beta-hydroxylase domain-containing protein [Pseudohalioglobus sediminis]|uniref:Aspartyl/asparaginyl beta-hydroxylase domain-containing protein n=1 Tax=Pseudohalioglobus sediminis TaxID=2606449 RepID=A0A5B0WMX8_9GAMM|nr:aspartyl/asparaginyl beta-hydroxylase domain-containing protein [Pseudohalioglobus sediminis]KAA1188414.1 aspartyl/asparaginyl beta-hydroxylase domain-containing protein [Pseudohalioglobus sediminis]